MAGPDMPPVLLASSGFLPRRSMRMPSTVLMRLTASAPASSQAFAMSAMLVTLGESLTITGFWTASFTARVTAAAAFGSVPKLMPPPCTFGQEILTSSQPTCPHASSLRQTSTYSSMEKPLTLAMTGFWKTRCSFGSSSAITASTPGFCRPTALSIPPGASAMRGCALPVRGCRVVPLKENVPRQLIS